MFNLITSLLSESKFAFLNTADLVDGPVSDEDSQIDVEGKTYQITGVIKLSNKRKLYY